ncbi:LYR motif-containing protein 2 isoform X1 [Catharus ustulatus]|uniref:LYR motif-containing protein 2 isoform X1 n=1 Tax=Catharus ustulatus TaxID=91951 RepID=UPI0014085086|nr:LYR motif-containing protein 2 isoform X1 [Catharus ustulatus]
MCAAQLAALFWGSGQTSLSPCQFLRRQQVLQLYRKILRAIREVPADQDRRYLKDWAREEFKRNKDATEEDAIRMMITQGNMQLQELQRTLKLAKS